MNSTKASIRNFLVIIELLANSAGFAGCLMLVYAFAYILMYGHANFVEPNVTLADLELAVFAIGGLANIAVLVERYL